MCHCEGRLTWLIHGGDYASIEPPERYLDRLVSMNSVN
jgi:hypothetical protein